MGKFLLNPIFDKVSGRFKRLVTTPYTQVLNIAGEQVSGTIRVMGDHTNFLQESLNLRRAFQITSQKWVASTLAEKDTWNVQAKLISTANEYRISGFNLFMAYFLEGYAAFMGLAVNPTDLSAGVSWNYVDRASHAWS